MGGASHVADRLSPDAIWNGGMSSYPREVRWRLGFVWQTYSSFHMGIGKPYTNWHRLIIIPFWFPTVVLGLAPAAWVWGERHRVGLIDLMCIVAAIALALAFLGYLVRAMNETRMT